MTSLLVDRLRAWPWLLAAVVATAVVGLLHPYQLGVLVWSLSKLALGAWLGYWIDRSIFYYARPGSISVHNPNVATAYVLAAAMLRRALIIAAALIALGLGV
ncbi:MAG: putative holin [Aquisalimonadaceae bacterium]